MFLSSFLLVQLHGTILDLRRLHAPCPSTRDKHCGALQAPWGGRHIHLLDPLVSCFMMGQGSLTARSYLSVRILNINISNSLSLYCSYARRALGMCKTFYILIPLPGGQEGYLVPFQMVESSKEADCPSKSKHRRLILPKEGIIFKMRAPSGF